MKKALVFAFVAVAALLLVESAFACTQMCTRVPGTFCRVCEDTGEYTGAGCQQSGPCGCFFVQVICADGSTSNPLGLEEPLMSTVEPTDMFVDQSFEASEELAPADDAPAALVTTSTIG